MTEALTTDSPKPTAEPPKKSCLGCAFKGGLGCLAFFVGAVVILALVGPGFLAKKVIAVVREDFNEKHEGSLEIAEYELAWTEPQHVRGLRILDPGGQAVLEGTLEFPGIIDSLKGLGTDPKVFRLGRIVGEVSGSIVVGEDGVSNLDHALELRESARRKQNEGPAESDDEVDASLSELLSKLEFLLELKAPSLRYSDPRTRALGTEVAMQNLELQVRSRARGSWTLNANADILSEAEGRMDVRMTARNPDWYDADWPLGELAFGVDLRDVSTAFIDGLAGQGGRLSEALGPLLNLDLDVEDVTANAGRIDLQVRSARQELTVGGRFEAGEFLMQGSDQLAWSLEAPTSLLEPHVAAAFPSELTLHFTEPSHRWKFELRDVTVPILAPETSETTVGQEPTNERLYEILGNSRFDAQLELQSLRLDREGSGSVHLPELILSTRQSKDGLSSKLSCDLTSSLSETPGTCVIEVRPRNAWNWLADEEQSLAWEADGKLHDLALRPFLATFGVDSEHLALLDGKSQAELHLRDGRDAACRIDGKLASDSLRVELTRLLSNEHYLVRSLDDEALVVEVESAALLSVLAPLLPEGMSLALPAGARRVVVESLTLPLRENGSREVDLEGLQTRVRLEAGELGLTLDNSKNLALQNVMTSVVVPSSAPPRLELTAAFARQAGSSLRVQLNSLPTWSELIQISDLGQARCQLELFASKIPSVIVDDFAEQDGLIVDVLGPTLDLTCKSPGLGLNEGPLVVHMDSELGTFDWSGRLQAGALLSSGEDQLVARVGLSPLFNERIIGGLVPLLVDAKKEPGAEPVLLSLRESSLPLGGDLTQLNGKLRLDLGAVQYRVLPQLEELLGKQLRTKDSVIAPIEIEIVNGVARYEGVAIRIGDNAYDFTGSMELTSKALDFQTTVPLGNLGSRVDRSVSRLVEQGLLSPDIAVPVSLGGTVSKPRVALKEGFLAELTKGLVPGAVEGLLKKGLDKLLRDH